MRYKETSSMRASFSLGCAGVGDRQMSEARLVQLHPQPAVFGCPRLLTQSPSSETRFRSRKPEACQTKAWKPDTRLQEDGQRDLRRSVICSPDKDVITPKGTWKDAKSRFPVSNECQDARRRSITRVSSRWTRLVSAGVTQNDVDG